MSSLRSMNVARTMLALLVAASVAGFASLGAASAQEGTPTAAACDSPGLPPGTPTAVDAEASPEATEDMDMASPVAMEVPPAPVLPEGQPVDAGVAGAITATIENYVACYNEGQAAGDPGLYVALETDNYILEMTGSSNPYDRVLFESEGGPPATKVVQSVANPMTYDDGRVSADVQVLQSDHWLIHNRMFLALGEDLTWELDQEFYQRPLPDTETITVNGVNTTETTDESTGQVIYVFEWTGGTNILTVAEAMIFNVANSGEELHEAVVLQLPEGADPLGLLDDSVSFEDVAFIGGVFPVFPGETKDLALMNLEPGTYTLVCFIPGPDGAPHAVNGMIGQFEVVAAEA